MARALSGVSCLFAFVALSSIFNFLAALAGVTNAAASFAAAALAAVVAAIGWRRRPTLDDAECEDLPLGWQWGLAGVFALAQLLLLIAAWNALQAKPHGDWDAWSIWNLRARMMAAGQWAHAVSPDFSNHPDYPMLTSSFIAQWWTVFGASAGRFPVWVSQLVAFLFYAGAAAVLVSGLAVARNRSTGWTGGLLLAASAGYFVQGATQYADIPLSLYCLLALVWLALDQPVPAGFFAACAAWTKNEGSAFAVVFLLVATLVMTDRKRLWLGAAPVAAFVAFFKLVVAAPTAGSVSVVAGQLAEGARWSQILSAAAGEVAGMGLGWLHPLLLCVLLAAGLGLRRTRAGLAAAIVVAAQLAIYFGVYLTTKEDLSWLLSTSANRLFVQVWPCLIFTAMLWLNPITEPTDPTQLKKNRTDGAKPRRRAKTVQASATP